jgi:hypothetical protein
LETWPESFVTWRAREHAKCVGEKGISFRQRRCFHRPDWNRNRETSGTRQRVTHSSHKRHNCLKFQAISAPDGLVLPLFGPVEGRRHDMLLYKRSGIDDGLRSSLVVSNRQYYLYRDTACILCPYLQAGFNGWPTTPEEPAFNPSMSKVRDTVERYLGMSSNVLHMLTFQE